MNPRFEAIREIRARTPVPPIPGRERSSRWFGEQVFGHKLMKQHLPEDIYNSFQQLVLSGKALPQELARPLASAIKSWALDKGATHYAHWLQPLSGQVAEKHNSFLDLLGGEAIDSFSAEQLRQTQPDESSFPMGGQRSTFEARGSMVWDCQSPVFIFETTYGKTLVIPTLFVSHSGEALDYKSPLLQSIALLEEAAVPICHYFDPSVKQVFPTLGLEQEYFLIDKSLFDLRPDLALTGRMLVGGVFPHERRANAQYFSAIPERVYAFMNELEQMAHRLGIPLKTRQNEIAPGQFESASQYEQVNLAIDHGLMVMDLVQRVARKHGFAALLHEKPFAGIIGSSKHNNWSLETEDGKNLLSPGETPEENLLFLIFFVSMIRALHTHAPLIGAMMASGGNDLRLGFEDAPPRILSLFVGRHLRKVLQDIETPPRRKKNEKISELEHLGIAEIPHVLADNTDRNRTSPIAFTGNKFEFRMVGSSSNCAGLMILLNLILASQLKEFKHRVDAKRNRGRKTQLAILDILREYIGDSKGICFEGDSHSQDWNQEAKDRNLFRLPSTPFALEHLLSPGAFAIFEDFSQGSSADLQKYQAGLIESYLSEVKIERDIIKELAQTVVLPLATDYHRSLLSLIQQGRESKAPAESYQVYQELALQIGQLTQNLYTASQELEKLTKTAEKEQNLLESAKLYADQIRPHFDHMRLVTETIGATFARPSLATPKNKGIVACDIKKRQPNKGCPTV